MKRFQSAFVGFSYRHLKLEGGLPGLYRDDGIHLSKIGLLSNLSFKKVIILMFIKLSYNHNLAKEMVLCIYF